MAHQSVFNKKIRPAAIVFGILRTTQKMNIFGTYVSTPAYITSYYVRQRFYTTRISQVCYLDITGDVKMCSEQVE